MSSVVRHGLPAGVAVVLGGSAGLLGNAFSNGWAWPVGVAFGLALLVEAGWVGSRAVAEHRRASTSDRDANAAGGTQVNQVKQVSARDGQAIGINNGIVYQDRGQ